MTDPTTLTSKSARGTAARRAALSRLVTDLRAVLKVEHYRSKWSDPIVKRAEHARSDYHSKLLKRAGKDATLRKLTAAAKRAEAGFDARKRAITSEISAIITECNLAAQSDAELSAPVAARIRKLLNHKPTND